MTVSTPTNFQTARLKQSDQSDKGRQMLKKRSWHGQHHWILQTELFWSCWLPSGPFQSCRSTPASNCAKTGRWSEDCMDWTEPYAKDRTCESCFHKIRSVQEGTRCFF